jgi:hypothetical protein
MAIRRITNILALLVLSIGLHAQDFRATLSGIVTDPSGGAIPEATVKAISVETNTAKEARPLRSEVTIPYLNREHTSRSGRGWLQTLIRRPSCFRCHKLNLPFS